MSCCWKPCKCMKFVTVGRINEFYRRQIIQWCQVCQCAILGHANTPVIVVVLVKRFPAPPANREIRTHAMSLGVWLMVPLSLIRFQCSMWPTTRGTVTDRWTQHTTDWNLDSMAKCSKCSETLSTGKPPPPPPKSTLILLLICNECDQMIKSFLSSVISKTNGNKTIILVFYTNYTSYQLIELNLFQI